MPKVANPTDRYVGGRVRMRRMMLNMSQEKLGRSLNLTFQQIQKYEKGANRIGAGRLMNIAELLGVPVTFFFEGAPTTFEVGSPSIVPSAAYVGEFLTTREGLDLVMAFMAIPNLKTRRAFVALAEQMAVAAPAEVCHAS